MAIVAQKKLWRWLDPPTSNRVPVPLYTSPQLWKQRSLLALHRVHSDKPNPTCDRLQLLSPKSQLRLSRNRRLLRSTTY